MKQEIAAGEDAKKELSARGVNPVDVEAKDEPAPEPDARKLILSLATGADLK